MEYILFVIFLIPAMLGLAEIIHMFKRFLLKPHSVAKVFTVAFLDRDNARQQLLFLTEQYLWQGKRYSGNMIAVYSGISAEDYDYCLKLSEEYGITLCSESELAKKFTD